MAGLDEEELKNIKQFNEYVKNAGKSVGGFSNVIAAVVPATKLLGASTVAAGAAIGGLAKIVEGSENAYKKLSNSGINFSNDLIGMQNAAIQSRMDLDDFAEMVASNGRNLAGLGGNINRGAEAFGKLSAEFHQSDLNLRMMGYSTDEMNDLLIQQLGLARVSDMKDQAGRTRILHATQALATEMDLTSKLTGQSRKELQEEMHDKRRQARLNAALNDITKNMAPEVAASVRESAQIMLQQAKQGGFGDAMMEMITTGGTVYSEKAGQQAAIMGEATSDAFKAFQALTAGNKKLADDQMKNAIAASVKLQNDPAYNTMVRVSGAMGSVGDTIVDTAASMKPLVDGINSLRTEADKSSNSLETYRKYLDQTIADLKNAQDSKDKEGKDVGGAMLLTQTIAKGSQDVMAAVADTLAKELGPYIQGKLGNLANQVPQDLQQNTAKVAGEAVDKVKKFFDDPEKMLSSASEAMGKAVGQVFKESTDSLSTTLTKLDKTLDLFLQYIQKEFPGLKDLLPGRATGSLGATGKLTEDFGSGTPVMLHGNNTEGVHTIEDLTNMATGSYNSGMQDMASQMQGMFKSVGSVQPQIVFNPETGVSELAQATEKFMGELSGKVTYGEVPPEISEQFKQMEKSFADQNISDSDKNQKAEEERQNSGLYSIIKTQISNAQKLVENIGNITSTSGSPAAAVAPISNAFKSGKLDLNSFSLDNNGMPMLRQQSATKTETKPDTKPADNTQQSEQQKQTAAQQQATQQATKQTDVMGNMLEELKKLNEQFSEYLHQHERLGKKQISATKQNSGNLYHG